MTQATVPLPPPRVPDPHQNPVVDEKANHNGHLLIVEDSLTTTAFVKQVLACKSYRISNVKRGEEALRLAARDKPDLILLDILMPDMDGYEVCRRLQRADGKLDVPVMFMSSLAESFDKVRAFELGAVDYVTKPLSPAELRARVATHMMTSRLHQQLSRQAAELQKSELRYRELFESSNDAILVNGVDEHGNVLGFTDVNAVACRWLGYDREELLAMTFWDIMPQGSARQLAALFRGVVQQEDHVFEHILRTKRSDLMPVEISSRIFERQGERHIISAVRDITERKRAEAERREGVERFRTVFDNATDAMLLCEVMAERGPVIVDANDSTTELFGYSREELLGMAIAELDKAESAADIPERARRIMSGEKITFETCYDRRDGARIQIEVSTRLISVGGKPHIHAAVRDITARKKAEAALRESEERFRTVFDNAIDMMFILDMPPDQDFVITDANNALTEVLGYAREEMIGKPVTALAGPGPREDPAGFFNKVRSGKRVTFESRRLRKDGRPVTFEVSLRGVTIGGKPKAYAVCRDITARKMAEEELRKAKSYIANVIDSMPSMLVGVDTDGVVTQWNPEAERITGLPAAQAVGQTLGSVVPRLAGAMGRVRDAISSRRELTETKKAHQHGGETRYEDVTIYPLIANGVDGAVIRIDDVTEQVRVEEMLVQSEKMLSVGGLAAGMAHEINNPLAGMIQTAGVMSTRLSDADLPANRRAAEEAGITMQALRAYLEARDIVGMLTRIRDSGTRAADIVTNMLSFARNSDGSCTYQDLAKLLDQAVDLAGSDYDLKRYDFRQIEVVREYEEGLPPIFCEKSKLQQVFLNILRNGAEAMCNLGKEEGRKPRFILRLQYEKEAEGARIEIEDNGPGMDAATSKRVFEPFFTTKPVGAGTGLGLSVSYFIVTESFGGEMAVESELGSGSKFIISLPLG